MRGNIGKFLIIFLPLLVAGYALWPTYRAWQLESDRAKVEKDSVRLAQFEKTHADDIADAKKKRIKLGLDLRGGIYVTLEVDVIKLLEEAAQRDAVDDTFTDVIQKTRNEAEQSEEAPLDIFLRNFTQIARPKNRTLISYFEIGDMRNVKEEDIIKKLRTNIDDAIDQAKEVIRQRIDKFGLSEVTLQKQGTRRITLELPGVTNVQEVRQLLQTTARLEFKLVRNNAEIVHTFYAIDQYLKNKESKHPVADTTKKTDSTAVAANDSTKKTVAAKDSTKKDSTGLVAVNGQQTDSAKAAAAKKDTSNPYAGLSQEEQAKHYQADHPFSSLFITYFLNDERPVEINYIHDKFPDGEYIFKLPAGKNNENLKKFQDILAMPAVRKMIGSEYQVSIAAKPDSRYKVEVFDFFALKAEPELTGDVLTDAIATFDPSSNAPMVLMEMNSDGAERWARITGANIKKKIAIVLDDRVYSAPTVQNKITGGSSQITGSANIDEARLLQIVLKAGALKAPVSIIEERVVGPSLGEDSIKSGLYASLVAALLVILFMILYYSTGGLLADLAVIVNVLLILALLISFGGTLTLPGIGGIMLTIGMAVDANVLVFERIREELRHGRSLKAAIDEGYTRALAAILDSNITSLMTGTILAFVGTGPIRGFAITMIIGIFMTLFTAVFLTRTVLNIYLSRGITTFNFGQPHSSGV